MNLHTASELGEHRVAWDAMVDESPRPTAFLKSWWLENTVRGEPLFLLVFEGEALMGGVALQQGEIAGVELLEFAGSGPLNPDQLDLVAKPGMQQRVRAEVCMWLRRNGNRIVDLKNLASDAALLDAPAGTGGKTLEETAPYITLPDSAEVYLKSRRGQLRSTITRTKKRLEKAGIVFERLPASDAALGLETIRALHDARWGDDSEFLTVWDGFEAAVLAGSKAGEVRFHQLRGPDGPIAIEVDFVVADRMLFYQSGRLTDHEYRGSGSVLRYEIICAAIEEGLSEFDLLLGGESYKAEWASGSRELFRERRGVGPKGRAVAAAAHANYLNVRRKEAARLKAEAEAEAPTRVFFYTDSTQLGGAESVAANLLAGLDACIDITIAGVDETVVETLGRSRPKANRVVLPAIEDRSDFAAMAKHRKAIAEAKPHIFHANLSSGSSCQYAILAAISVSGVKVVAVENSPMGVQSDTSRKLKRAYCSRLDAHIAVSEATAAAVVSDVGLNDGALEVIANGMAPVDVEPRPRPVEGLLIGTVSRFDPVKGLDVLIRAAAKMDDVHVEIIGDGPERSNLEALAAELGVDDRIHMDGYDPEARHRVANFDVFVLPSRLEGMPMSILEAMLAGVAVLSTNVGGVGEVIEDGVNGVLVAPDDPDALAAATLALLADDERRAQIAAAGETHVLESFGVEKNVSAFEALYQTLRG